MKKNKGMPTFAGILLLTLISCGPRKDEVRIAMAIPLTGDIASLGQGINRAALLAVEQANASHKFPFVIALTPFDDRSDPKEAVSVANRIIADSSVVAVIGHFNSGCSI